MPWLLCLILFFAAFGFDASAFAAEQPLARDGRIDLRAVDLARASVALRGEWRFYPQVFLKAADLQAPDFKDRPYFKVLTERSWTDIPELRDFAYGTFYLQLQLPEHPDILLGWRENIGINSAFELELAPEGKIIARSGRPATAAADEVDWWLRKDFPLPEVGRRDLDLLLRVSSFHYIYKGILIPPTIGEWDRLNRESFLQRLGTVAAAATLFSLAFYHLMLFALRRDDSTNLIFALTSLVMSMRLITTDRLIEEIFPGGLPFYAAINFRVLYASMSFSALLIYSYYCQLIDGFPMRLARFGKAAKILSWILGLLPFVIPDYQLLHKTVLVFEGHVVVAIGLGTVLLIRHALRHPLHAFEARVCLALAIGFIVAIGNDLGYVHYLWNTTNVVPYALIGLFIGQSLLVARKYRYDFALRKNLQESRAVQEAFLPAEESVPSIRSCCHYQVADEQAGGDLYDLRHDAANERYYAFIGDVTGHGIASALVAGAASGAIHSTLAVCQHQGLSLEETLRELAFALNLSVLSAGRRAERFMTFTILGLDLRTGAGMYVNAGHNATFLIQAKRTQTLLKASSPLGLHAVIPFLPTAFQIEPGTRIFLYTDGLLENTGVAAKTLKIKKVTEMIAKAEGLTHAREDILRYGAQVWEQYPPEDDVTFVILEWDPRVAAA